MPTADLPETLDWECPYSDPPPDAVEGLEGATFWYQGTEYEVTLWAETLFIFFHVAKIERDDTGRIATRQVIKGGWRHDYPPARIAALNCARRAAMGVEEIG